MGASPILRVGISVLLLFLMFRFVDGKALWAIIKNSDPFFLIQAFAVTIIVDVLCFLRWDMLLRASGIRLPFKTLLKPFAGGLFFNIFLPSSIGGDIVRSLDLSAHTKKGREVVSTVFLDRLSGYVGLVLVMLVSLAFGWTLTANRAVLICAGVLTAFLAAILLVLFNSGIYKMVNNLLYSPDSGKIRSAIQAVHNEIFVLGKKDGVLVLNLCFSVAVQILSPVISYLICRSLGLNVNLFYFFVFTPIIGAITLLPISIGGLGLRDAVTVFFFSKAGIGANTAFAMSLLGFGMLAAISVLGGVYYVITLHNRRV